MLNEVRQSKIQSYVARLAKEDFKTRLGRELICLLDLCSFLCCRNLSNGVLRFRSVERRCHVLQRANFHH